MMLVAEQLEWVAFDRGTPYALADDESLVRWAQAHQMVWLTAWRADRGTETVKPYTMQREGTQWRFMPKDSVELTWNVPADPSDDPLVLRIVDQIEAATANGIIEAVRWVLPEWPPDDLHADMDPNRIGVRLGSVYDMDVISDVQMGHYWHYCPDRIALVARDLLVDDVALRQLLAYLEGRINLTMTHGAVDPAEREDLIDKSFMEANPSLRETIAPVMFRAMDMEL